MKSPKSNSTHDEFETALVVELQHLRTSERLLQRMYPRLKSKPQLRDRFLQQLAEMQLRAQRLDAVLSPMNALQSPLPVAPAAITSAA
jgi:ferritin-like metal-binding protein YciE